MLTITGMRAGGFYDSYSTPQRAALEAALAWLNTEIAGPLTFGDKQPYLGILDIGSSEGENAVYAAKQLVHSLRNVSRDPIWVWFDDLPTNDFNHLFENLFPHGDLAIAEPEVYSAVIGGSAFGRLMPPGTIHIASTFDAISFLQRQPNARLPNYILPMGPGPLAPRRGVSVTDVEREPFRQQAARDLRQFYTVRAQELVSGGKLLVQFFGRNDELSTSYGIYDVLNDALLDLVETGKIPRHTFEQLLFPIYFRTLDELIEPIVADPQLRSCFRIERSDSSEVPVPFNLELEETSNVVAWAKSYVSFLRACTESILSTALVEINRPDIVDRVYQRVEMRLSTDPERYEFHYISITALLTRL